MHRKGFTNYKKRTERRSEFSQHRFMQHSRKTVRDIYDYGDMAIKIKTDRGKHCTIMYIQLLFRFKSALFGKMRIKYKWGG